MAFEKICGSSIAIREKMLVIDLWCKKPKYTLSTASDAHGPLPQPVAEEILHCWDSYDWQKSSDALTDWMNARWEKTGYNVSRKVVCFTLRMRGRDALMGLGDHLCGNLVREEVPGLQSWV